MLKFNYKLLILIILGIILWFLPVESLDKKSWHLLVIFIVTILGIVSNALAMGAIAFLSLTVCVITNTLSLKDALSGFSSHTTWLIIAAFFIARTLVLSGLGERIAYLLISKFGKNSFGLAYSLIITELILSPMIPSTTARGGGIMFPVVNSLASVYMNLDKPLLKTSRFLISLCFHTNVITCAIFLTAMAGNSLIADLARSVGIELTWLTWATFAIVPGIINLALLPWLLYIILKPERQSSHEIPLRAKQVLKDMGKMKHSEKIMLATFVFMLFLWVAGPSLPSPFNFNATVTALLGFSILLVTGIANWKECVNDKGVWETVMWFATLLMIATKLSEYGIINWLKDEISILIGHRTGYTIVIILILLFFYIHYFFASVTAHATVMYTTFVLLIISMGVNPLVAALALASLANLSGGLTHYGINTAPIYFSANYFSVKEWWKVGFIVCTFNLILWLTIGYIWLYILGWL
ncbi:MAG: DASS family sodium-coupled anion symporter [Solitalea-like symbiont of Tyrophagus putrescentiae]